MVNAAEHQARGLIYPLRQLDDSMYRYLRSLTPPDPRGALIAIEIMPTLRRCEKIARSLFPFDPTGL